MPVGLAWARLERIKEGAIGEERKRRHELYVQAKTVWHALTQYRPVLPTSKEEEKQEPDYEERKRYARFREDHDEMVMNAFSAWGHPYHFETLMHFAGHLFDEPPDPEAVRAAQKDIKEAERERVLRQLKTLWEDPPSAEGNHPPEEDR